MFFHIINHFSPQYAGAHLDASTVFSASLAIRSPLVASVLVVDGSARENPSLAAALQAIGAEYCHADRALNFAEGFNLGISRSDQPWTILSANDIYPAIDVFEAVANASAHGSDPTIGCVIPFLTYADLEMQAAWDLQHVAPCAVPLMTLNFNAFPTEYLRSIGGVPSEYSGGYNDVLMAHRIQQDGRQIVIARARCLHMARLTIESGETMVDFDADAARFKREQPELYMHGSYWDLNLARFMNTRLLRLLARLIRYIPTPRRRDGAARFLRLVLRQSPRIKQR